MSIHPRLAELAGTWTGTNRLNMSWEADPWKTSPSTATVSPKVSGQFLEIFYTWQFDGAPQEGTLFLGCDDKSDAVQAVWTDSWHMSHKFMLCDGTISAEGNVDIVGSYSVPDNPDWRWRTEIKPFGAQFVYRMFNVSPEGAEELAVETEFSRP